MKTTPLGYSLASPSTDSPALPGVRRAAGAAFPPQPLGGRGESGWRGGVNDTPNEVVRYKTFSHCVYMECQ